MNKLKKPNLDTEFIDRIKWLKRGSISIFPHWLNEAEADDCKILSYSIAQSSGKLAEYLDGEQRLMHFYISLSDHVWCYIDESWRFFLTNSSDFKTILKNSLRENNIKFFDLYFSNYVIRLQGGFDRTDTFFIANIEMFERFIQEVEKNDLYILGLQDIDEPDHYFKES